MVVNATGPGKDRLGSPLTIAALFPEYRSASDPQFEAPRSLDLTDVNGERLNVSFSVVEEARFRGRHVISE
jgi:hypothetical protein